MIDMGKQDIRWKQRYEHYREFVRLLKVCIREGEMDEMRKMALLHIFVMTVEMGWKLVKDYLEYQGIGDAKAPKQAIRHAPKVGIMTEAAAQVWIDAIDARNAVSHAYSEAFVQQLAKDTEQSFLPVFERLEEFFEQLYKQD